MDTFMDTSIVAIVIALVIALMSLLVSLACVLAPRISRHVRRRAAKRHFARSGVFLGDDAADAVAADDLPELVFEQRSLVEDEPHANDDISPIDDFLAFASDQNVTLLPYQIAAVRVMLSSAEICGLMVAGRGSGRTFTLALLGRYFDERVGK